jgi:RNA-binding protein
MSKRSTNRITHSRKSIEKPEVIIGKNGPTDFLVNEISKRLNHRKVVKVKILKSALVYLRAEEIAHKISDATGARIIEIRGHTFTLHRSKKNRKGIYNAPSKYSEKH